MNLHERAMKIFEDCAAVDYRSTVCPFKMGTIQTPNVQREWAAYPTAKEHDQHLIELGLLYHDGAQDALCYTQYGIDYYLTLGRI